MKTLNNKGMTLVEMVLAILILGIAGIMLVESFVSSMNIINRATLLKNASTAASNSVELQNVQTSPDKDVKIAWDNTLNKNGESKIKIKATATKENANSRDIECEIVGTYIVAHETNGTNLRYREFLPNDFSFNVPASSVDGN